jgi:hypothetical protein
MPGAAVAGIADFNADGRADVLWRHGDGQLELWYGGEQGNSTFLSYYNRRDVADPIGVDWHVLAGGDFDGNGYADIYWQHDGGDSVIWYMTNGILVSVQSAAAADPGHVWALQGVGDFDGDHRSDILWRNIYDYSLRIWFANNTYAYPTWHNIPGAHGGADWTVRAVLDANKDGLSDIVWHRMTTGELTVWPIDNGQWGGCAAPVSCGSCGGTVQCDGTCSIPNPPNLGAACGSCGGTIQCNGACSIPTPSNLGRTCGSCGGTIQCNGACSIPTPTGLGQPCGGGNGRRQCDGSCRAVEP